MKKKCARLIFEDGRFGCPAYDCSYGFKCPAMGKSCYFEDCPIIYWMEVFDVIQSDETEV